MTQKQVTTGVAIIGCGTVGCAAAEMLTNDAELISKRCGKRIELRHIVDVDFARARQCGLDASLFRDDIDKVLGDESVQIVAELVGGTTIAKTIVEKALNAGKHVVTANKALLAHHGTELWTLARSNNVCIAFEGSCAGGVPVIGALCGGLLSNRIDALFGIVNGTCNYILTEMTERGQSYDQALAQAQADGLAEADPTLDVAGIDSAHKIAILAALAFGRQIDFDDIPTSGIDSLETIDIQSGQELGYVIKLLAIAQHQAGGLSIRVRPAFISKGHPLAWVSGPFNAVSVYGHANGHTMYYGRGAGGFPTASAVVSDITAIALGTAQRLSETLGIWPDQSPQANQLKIEAVQSRYYLRIMAEDRPGVLGKVADILAEYDISICSVLQHESPHVDAGVPVIITTYDATEGNVMTALQKIDALDVIKSKTTCISIVNEHEERL
jgi:homoserine dehydrogenase